MSGVEAQRREAVARDAELASAFASVPGVIIIGTGDGLRVGGAQGVVHEPHDLGVGRPLDRRAG